MARVRFDIMYESIQHGDFSMLSLSPCCQYRCKNDEGAARNFSGRQRGLVQQRHREDGGPHRGRRKQNLRPLGRHPALALRSGTHHNVRSQPTQHLGAPGRRRRHTASNAAGVRVSEEAGKFGGTRRHPSLTHPRLQHRGPRAGGGHEAQHQPGRRVAAALPQRRQRTPAGRRGRTQHGEPAWSCRIDDVKRQA